MAGKSFSKLAAVMFALLCLGNLARADDMEKAKTALDARQEKIVTIAAFTANGNLPELKTALNGGLDAGLTVNEIKEVLIQLYAYAGFPRSLNGIQTFMTVMDEREKAGIADPAGAQGTALPAGTDRDAYGEAVRMRLSGVTEVPAKSGYQLFAPGIDVFLKEHLFADIFGRGVLEFSDREIATVAALAALGGTDAQLQFHLNAAMNVGLSQQQLAGIISVLEKDVGKNESALAGKVFGEVLKKRSNINP